MGGRREGDAGRHQGVRLGAARGPRGGAVRRRADRADRVPRAARARRRRTRRRRRSADFAAKVSREEPDYLLVPLRAAQARRSRRRGVDLAIVVDTSAATETGALERGAQPRRPRCWRSSARTIARRCGRATRRCTRWRRERRADGARRGQAARMARGARRRSSAAARPTSARSSPRPRASSIRSGAARSSTSATGSPRSARSRPRRCATGSRASRRARASSRRPSAATRTWRSCSRSRAGRRSSASSDAYGAARLALRLLEAAQRPTWVGATVDLGPGVERVLPARAAAGRRRRGRARRGARVGPAADGAHAARAAGETVTQHARASCRSPTRATSARRWGEGRLAELLDEGAGRAAIVDVGRRFGLVSPFTSLYVPTAREVEEQADTADLDDVRDEQRRRRWKPWWHGTARARARRSLGGGAGVRQQGGRHRHAREGRGGVDGQPQRQDHAAARYGVQGPRDELRRVSRQAALNEAAAVRHDRPACPPRPATARAEQAEGACHGGGRSALAAPAAMALSAQRPRRHSRGAGRSGARRPRRQASASATSAASVTAPGTGTGQGIGTAGGRLGGAHQTRRPGRSGRGATHRERTAPARGHPAHRPPELRALPPLLRERAAEQPEPAGARGGEVRHRSTRRGRHDRNDGGSEPARRRASSRASCAASATSASRSPKGGIVTVVYPIVFAPGDGACRRLDAGGRRHRPPARSPSSGTAARPCGAAADLPFDERRSALARAARRRGDGSRRARRVPPRARRLRGADVARAAHAARHDGGSPAARARARRALALAARQPRGGRRRLPRHRRARADRRRPARAARRAGPAERRSGPARRRCSRRRRRRPTGSPCCAPRR